MRFSPARLLTAALAALTLVVLGIGLSTPAQADSVSQMTAPIFHRANPSTNANLLTAWADESAGAPQFGFTTDLGVPFKASLTSGTGLTAVRKLFKASTADFTWALAGSSSLTSLVQAGYADQGVAFYASATEVAGRTQPVTTYTKGSMRRMGTPATASALQTAGWTASGVAFHVAATTATPTPKPTVTPTVAPTPTPTPTPPVTPPATGVGAAPIGSASYTAPAGAVYAATSGNDSAAGTLSAPVRTLGRALAIAPSGGTVVLRGGTYNESVTISRTVTVQNQPGEAVWLDSSIPMTGWVADGSTWRQDNWGYRFDSSPTYTPGAPDNTNANWAFVNKSTYPMAAHPDQVFVNGTPLQQVASRAQVSAGTFFLDTATSKVYIGTNPGGQSVAGSTKIKALSVQAANTVIRGIGIRRYSPSVAHIGSVTLEAPGIRLENVEIADSATTGVALMRENITLDRVTIKGSGMLGIHGRYADNSRLIRVLSTQNNDEHFNIAPVSGGAKFGNTRGVRVESSSFSGNYGHGFWDDMSVYDTTLVNSTFSDNSGDGIFLEISNKAVIANNFVARNAMDGLKINNTSNVQIWNNTIHGNANRPIWLAQDARRNTNINDPAVDRRVAFPDPGMTWTLKNVTLKNNVLVQLKAGGNSMIDNSDYSNQNTAEQMGLALDGNAYQRSAANAPSWLVIWSRGATSPAVFTTLAAFRSGTGQEARGREWVGGSWITDSNGVATSALTGVESSMALPLPANIAALVGKPAGSVHMGKW